MHDNICLVELFKIWKEGSMSSTAQRSTQGPATRVLDRLDTATASVALWLTLTTLLALVVLYFVGVDQGATSVFGSDTHVHEFVHDARHLLGFPCH
jgi:hypothetical protein